jgi:starch phosphorylase
MRSSMAELTPRFSSNRMVREYVEKLYIPTAEAYRERTGDDSAPATRILQGQESLCRHWSAMHFGDLRVEDLGQEGHRFHIPVYLDDLDPDLVKVELYAEPLDGDQPEHHMMDRGEPLAGAVNAHNYTATVSTHRPPGDYTPRIVPALKGAKVPLEAHQILWYR